MHGIPYIDVDIPRLHAIEGIYPLSEIGHRDACFTRAAPIQPQPARAQVVEWRCGKFACEWAFNAAIATLCKRSAFMRYVIAEKQFSDIIYVNSWNA
nr:hypothetical protein [Sinorhizobium medicae]